MSLTSALPSDIYGLTKMLHWPILQGQTVVVLPKFEIGAFCELVERYKVTINMLVSSAMAWSLFIS